MTGKIGYYVDIELVAGIVGETVTKYKTFDEGTRGLDLNILNAHESRSL